MIDNIESKIRAYSLQNRDDALTYDEKKKIAYDYLLKVVRNDQLPVYIDDDVRAAFKKSGISIEDGKFACDKAFNSYADEIQKLKNEIDDFSRVCADRYQRNIDLKVKMERHRSMHLYRKSAFLKLGFFGLIALWIKLKRRK